MMSRAGSALSNGTSIPWDDALKERAESNVMCMGEEGLRVMAAAYCDLDPHAFDADGDLLAYVEQLEMTSLVGMVDPPREESKGAVESAQGGAHPRANGDRRRRRHRRRDRRAAWHYRRRDLGAEFAALSEEERLERIDSIGVVGRRPPAAARCCSPRR